MRAFYNPITEERLNERVLYVNYGITPETALENGWYNFDISPIHHDQRLYHLEENGVVLGDIPDTYKINWQQVPNNLDSVKTTLKKELAAIRYNKETDGITFNGSVLLTDRESQSTVAGAKTFSDIMPEASIDWKGRDGWVSIDRPTILAIAQAVGTHVQTCFSKERTTSQQIDAALIIDELATIASEIQTGWPETAGVNTPQRFDPFNRF